MDTARLEGSRKWVSVKDLDLPKKALVDKRDGLPFRVQVPSDPEDFIAHYVILADRLGELSNDVGMSGQVRERAYKQQMNCLKEIERLTKEQRAAERSGERGSGPKLTDFEALVHENAAGAQALLEQWQSKLDKMQDMLQERIALGVSNGGGTKIIDVEVRNPEEESLGEDF